jgi:hypothetical protein
MVVCVDVVNTGGEQASGGGTHNALYGQESRKVSLLRRQPKKGTLVQVQLFRRVVIKGSNRRTGIMADAIGALAELAKAVEQITALGMPNMSNRLSSCRLRSLVQ